MDVISKNNLIHLRNAEFTIFNNIIICNHLYKITKQPSDALDYGSTILDERFSYIHM